VTAEITMRKETEQSRRVAFHSPDNEGLNADASGGGARRTPAQLTADLARELEALGQLTGGVAHGFNNLLTIILGNMELLQRRLSGDPTSLRYVNNAIEGAKRGVDLTQQMLAFARRENLEPGVVNLLEAARGLVATLYGVMGPGVEIKADFARELWPVRTDLPQLELALVNLALNAREAMSGAGVLTLSAYNETVSVVSEKLAAGDYVRLTMADTGVGMDEATLARAVEPFFSTKQAGPGTGLGLSMVQGFAVQLGGGLRLASKPGEGTKVDLWLPRAIELAKPATPAGISSTESAAPCTVLVVDDDALIVMVTSDRLQALGHHVFEVQSGREALELLRSSVRIDVVLTDHVMPGMTGVQLAREIRAHWPQMPIILATGCADLPDIKELGLARLDKPYDLDALAAVIADLTRKAAAR
jgi:signal transduction histidine kinase